MINEPVVRETWAPPPVLDAAAGVIRRSSGPPTKRDVIAAIGAIHPMRAPEGDPAGRCLACVADRPLRETT